MKLLRDFDLTATTTFHVPALTRWYGEFENIEQILTETGVRLA